MQVPDPEIVGGKYATCLGLHTVVLQFGNVGNLCGRTAPHATCQVMHMHDAFKFLKFDSGSGLY